MNRNIRIKDVQSAQAMVEFALVLPILLLVILGIFAFGHLFFVYSSVVSASREAARWGAAVGEASSTQLRYEDCAAIRAAAVRVGSLAGVNPNTVAINYDDGPLTTVYANCPLVGLGPDPSSVHSGDRIVVTVTVQYNPIVPLVNIPSFPISAETARTIVKSVPVGDAPVAEDPCVTSTEMVLTASPATSVTGEPVTFSVALTADDGTTPTGTVDYVDLDGNVRGPINLAHGAAAFTAIPFQSAGAKSITVHYTSDNTCHMATALTDQPYTVNKAATTILSIADPNDPSMVDNEVFLNVQMAVVAPGAITSSGPVGEVLEITAPNGGVCSPLSATLESVCRFTPNVVDPNVSVTVRYPGSDHYLTSERPETHDVRRQFVTLDLRPDSQTIELGRPVTFTVQMTEPNGNVTIDGEQVSVSSSDGSCTIILGTNLSGSCTFTPTQAHNSLSVTAYYAGNADYDPADPDTVTVRVNAPVVSNCPTVGPMDFSTSAALQFPVYNTSPGNVAINLTAVRVTWPNALPSARLSEVRFGDVGGLGSCVTSGGQAGRNCVWQSSTGGLNPLTATLSSSGPSTWNNYGVALAAGATKYMRIVFDHALPSGGYQVELTIGSCTVPISGTR